MRRSIASRKAIAAIFTAAWSIFGAQSGYGQPPVEEGKIYWTHPESGIHRSSLDGSNVEQLVIPDLRGPNKITLDIAGGKIYWTEREVADIHRSDLDGSNVETLIEGYGPPGWNWITDIALDVAGGKMYWTEGISHGDYIEGIVARANLDGSNIEVLLRAGHDLEDIALDLVKGKVYWTNAGTIQRADLEDQRWVDREEYSPDYIYEHIGYEYIGLGSTMSIALDVDRGKVYWTGAGTIQRADLDGQNVEEVLTISDGYPEEIIILDLDRDQIYWTNPGTQTIQRADLYGKNVEPFFDLGKLHLTGTLADIVLDVDGGKVYWTDASPENCRVCWGSGTIQRADLNGQNREILFDPVVRGPHGIALGIDKMYWTDVVKGAIQRADLDGSGMEVLVTGLDEPKGIALTAENKIYWADSGAGKIQAADLDNSQVEDIVTGLNRPDAIALDRDRSKIYWTNRDTVFRSNLDGSHIKKIATVVRFFGGTSSLGIALDRDRSKIYWTNRDTVFRSNLDGSHIKKIVTLDYRWDGWNEAIALDPIGGKIYWTGMSVGFNNDWFSPSPMYSEIFRSNLDGSNVEKIRSVGIERGLASTGIALDIPHPTFVSTPSTTPAIPTTSGLDPNFPNPFNASTQIAYRLATPRLVRLEIYNVLGQPVRTLVNQFQPAGFYQVRWDARDQRGAEVAAGVYLTRLRHPDGAQTRRLLYLK